MLFFEAKEVQESPFCATANDAQLLAEPEAVGALVMKPTGHGRHSSDDAGEGLEDRYSVVRGVVVSVGWLWLVEGMCVLPEHLWVGRWQ